VNRLVYLYNNRKDWNELMRSREIGKSHTSLTGFVLSMKDKLQKRFESALERDFLIQLDFDWGVDAFYDQPVSIPYFDEEGKDRIYTPDVLVMYRKDREPFSLLRPLLVEIKTKKDLEKSLQSKSKSKFQAAKEYAALKGWNFKILTEDQIRTAFLQNAYFLRPYRDYSPFAFERNLLQKTLSTMEDATPSSLVSLALQNWASDSECLEPPKSDDSESKLKLISMLWHLISVGQVITDFHRPLTMESSIWLLGQDSDKFSNQIMEYYASDYLQEW
jgi:hypothetical protein